MRKTMILAALVLAAPVRADWTRDAKMLSVSAGGILPLNKMEVRGTGSSDQRMGDMGLAVGGRYEYFVIPQIAIGMDLNYLKSGERDSTSVLANTQSTSKAKSTVLMAITKLALATEGTALPYLIGGLGLHVSSLKVDGTPTAGQSWVDTSTTESRTLVDDTRSHIAASAGAGLDFPLTAHWTLGLEGRYLYLGKSTFNATSRGAGAGLTSVNGVQHLVTVGARLGLQF